MTTRTIMPPRGSLRPGVSVSELGEEALAGHVTEDTLESPQPAAASKIGHPTMRGRLVTCDDPAWTSLLHRVPHDFYHLTSYLKLSANQESGIARAVLVEGGDRVFLLPLILRAIPGGSRDATTPYGYPGPIGTGLEDQSFVDAAFQEVRRVLSAEGITSLFVRFHPVLNEVVPDGAGLVVDHGGAVAIDLSQTAEALWQQMRKNHRRQIIKSIRSGHTVGLDESEEAFEAFKLLYRATMKRVDAPAYYSFDDAHFEELRSAMGERMRVAVVRIGHEVAAAGLFIEEGGIVEYHLSGSDERFAKFSPTKLITHFMTCWARERGNRWLHLGAGNREPDDALLHFKSGFSTPRHRFRTLRVVLDSAEYLRLAVERDPCADPTRLDGYFPAYRKP
jgi:CelD/BcsL family acetyltransferase involved in cellulose biosynthesis